MPEITSQLPQITFHKKDFPIPPGLLLADPKYNQTAPIDILLGAEVCWDGLTSDQMRLGEMGATLNSTALGWNVSGTISIPTKKRRVDTCLINLIHDKVEKFWKLEEIALQIHKNHEERAGEENLDWDRRRF